MLKDNKDEKYFFQSLETEDNYYLLWNKVRLNNTMFIEKGWEKNNIHKGISLDIFLLFDCPDNDRDVKKINRICKISKLLVDCNMYENKDYKTYGIAGKILFKIFKLIPQKLRNKIVIKNIKYLCNYTSSSEYYCGTIHGVDKKYSKDCFDKVERLPFEDVEFDCPGNYKKYLEEVFGDYMKLPDEEDRIGHGETYLCFDTTGDSDDE